MCIRDRPIDIEPEITDADDVAIAPVKEANFVADIDGIGKVILDGKSSSEVKTKIRKMLRKKEDLRSVERMTGAAKKKHFMSKAMGKEAGEDSIEETANVGDKKAPVSSQDMNYLSDFYKDVYGTRPRGIYKHVKTVGDYQKEIASLSQAAEAEQARVKQDRIERKKGKAVDRKIQRKRSFGPKGGTQKTTMKNAFQKALDRKKRGARR